MAVRIVRLGERRDATVEQVLDGGRRLIVDGEAFDLHPATARFVRAGQPYYGTRLVLLSDDPPARSG